MFELQSSFAPTSNMLARIDGEEEVLEVIGSGIAGSFEPRPSKAKLPMRLPNLNYKYPDANSHNFSPGTSLIFNAYRGHSDLLTQPYMAPIENAHGATNQDYYRRARGSLTQEAHVEQQQRQQLPYRPHESNSYPGYRHQKPLEHPPHRSPLEHQYHSYQSNSQPPDPRDFRDYRDSNDYRDYHDSNDYRDENPGIRSSQRSPGMPPSSSLIMPGSTDPMSQRIEHGHDSRARAPGQHYDSHRSHDDYPPQPSSQLPPSPQHMSSNVGHDTHTPPSYSSMPPPPPHWKRPDGDHGNVNHSYDGSSGNSNNQYQTQPQQRQPVEPWDTSDRRSSAIDIPQPRNRGSANYSSEYDRHGSTVHTMRGQHASNSQHPQHPQQSYAGGSMGSANYRGPFGSRAAGPQYSLTAVHYRMIFEYATEIRKCLIRGKAGTTDRLLNDAEILSKVFMVGYISKAKIATFETDPKDKEANH
ncbi:hypothetical protein BGZ65_002390 [Modicella reniformis]|uniref:Uncharacterized protein n=1 Tax=Modicella reniformis TaxID=1440133 RepID=A0A9P6M021_9FUNG|nr:hypothetical protein BGZ65_002390 [Modicella reniformis]